MYKKFVMQLFLCNMVLLTSWFCVKGVQMNMLRMNLKWTGFTDF